MEETTLPSSLLEHGVSSLDLRDEPLGPVLRRIAREHSISIFSTPAVDSQLVSIELEGQPLELALKQLLAGDDVFFQFASGKLRTVWVYEKGGGTALIPTPPDSWASSAEFERRLGAESPAERILALETLVARGSTRSLEYLTRALSDADGEVRLRALDLALSAGVTLPRETLTDLTYDEAPAVRALALEALVAGTEPGSDRAAETEQITRRLLGDADEEVRRRAREILDTPATNPAR